MLQELWSFVGIAIFFFDRIISFSLFCIITDNYVNLKKDVLELLICICQLESAFSLSSFPETDSEMPLSGLFVFLEGVNGGMLGQSHLMFDFYMHTSC